MRMVRRFRTDPDSVPDCDLSKASSAGTYALEDTAVGTLGFLTILCFSYHLQQETWCRDIAEDKQ